MCVSPEQVAPTRATEITSSLPLGAIPRGSRDGPAQARRAYSEEANSAVRDGPPAAAHHARPACRGRCGGSPFLPTTPPRCAAAPSNCNTPLLLVWPHGVARHSWQWTFHLPEMTLLFIIWRYFFISLGCPSHSSSASSISECVRSGNLMVALAGLNGATPSLRGRALLHCARTAIELDGTRSSSC